MGKVGSTTISASLRVKGKLVPSLGKGQKMDLQATEVEVLGDSDAPDLVSSWYDAGANTYIVKPVTFLALVRLMKVFTAYWLETAELPPGGE